MLTKEQIRQIESNKNLFLFIVELLEEMNKKGEKEMTIIFNSGKVIRRKKQIQLDKGKNIKFVSRFICRLGIVYL